MEETETLFANPLLDMKTIEYQRMIGNSGRTDEFFFYESICNNFPLKP